MPTPTVIREFARQAGRRPGLEPDVIETIVDFKDSYFGDPHPARWRVSELQELLLGVLPRKVSADDDWFAAVTPTTRAYLEFLRDRGRLAPGSDPAAALLATVDRIGDGVVAASRDPRNFGMAKAVFSAVGLDASAPDPLAAAMAAFNALPDAERDRILDPALRTLVPAGEAAGPLAGHAPSLPAIWLPPEAELATAARQAPLARALARLVLWNGRRHKVTRQEVLSLPDARRACADLGLIVPPGPVRSAEDLPALHRLWLLAQETDLLTIIAGTAVPGDAAAALTGPRADATADATAGSAAVLDWWLSLFETCVLEGPELANDEPDVYDLDLMDDVDADVEVDVEDVLDAVDEMVLSVLTELYPGTAIPLTLMDEGILDAVRMSLEELDEPGPAPEAFHATAVRRWRAHVDQLIEVGAATVTDDELTLTALGRYGVRTITLDDGGEAPVITDPAALGGAELLRALHPLDRAVAEPLLAAWSAGRTPTEAMEQLLAGARAGTAGHRMTATTVLRERFGDHLDGAGRPLLEAARDDDTLAAYAHALLSPPGRPVELPAHLHQWTALEAVALAIETGAFDDLGGRRDVPELEPLWHIVDQDGDLDSAWRSPHPQLTHALEAVAAHHPRGRARKAASKSLFKLRQPPKPAR